MPKDIYSQLKDQSIFLTGFQFVAISLTEDDTYRKVKRSLSKS